MRKPIPLTDIYPSDYITNHLDEMNTILSGRSAVVDGEYDSIKTRPSDLYRITSVRPEGITVSDDHDTKRYGYKRIMLTEITSIELDRLIENTKRQLRVKELDIEKYESWKAYLQENKLETLDVVNTNRMLLLSMLYQVRDNPEISNEEINTILSKVLSSDT